MSTRIFFVLVSGGSINGAWPSCEVIWSVTSVPASPDSQSIETSAWWFDETAYCRKGSRTVHLDACALRSKLFSPGTSSRPTGFAHKISRTQPQFDQHPILVLVPSLSQYGMSSQSRNNPFRAAIIVFTFVAAITLWRYSSGSTTSTATASRTAPDSPVMAVSKDHPNALSKLAVDIRQTATSPPTLAVKVTNNYDSPLTILTWESPLDPAAIALGLLSITPAGADKPLDLPIVQFRRVMPPEPDNLVTLQPGESRGQDLVLKEPAVPVGELGGKASIYIQGSWSSVWPTTADKLTPEELEKLQFGDSVLSGGEFKSDALEVTVG
ncbi:hypothetical protein VDGE_02972 [Verticillium dahliae]|nr:hypothetical protein VDGE_02972 [Verticillium dahliae]